MTTEQVVTILNEDLMARLEIYRREQDMLTLEAALGRLLQQHLPPRPAPVYQPACRDALVERAEKQQQRDRQAIINRAKQRV
jgi:hypothetical protein